MTIFYPTLCISQSNNPDTVVHFLLGASAKDGPLVYWCLVRYRPAGDIHFMPASRFELMTSGSVHPRASQYE